LKAFDVFIVAVPTPIDGSRRPDLGALVAASGTVGKAMRHGAVVIYESTVFPGCTREICIPVLEEMSGLVYNRDFHVGYSPERINPGDPQRRLTDIVKVTSGSTPEAAEAIDALYSSIVTAGTHKAKSIEVAEAAKVIENTQRDLNIALMNELSIIFHRLGLDSREVLETAGTKWNFLRFEPGLVGGHCIGVDPYYLTHRAQQVGFHPEVILAGRRVNDSMGSVVAQRVTKLLFNRRLPIKDGRVLVLGLAFKENCPDIRNSRVIDIINELRDFGFSVDAYDPWVNAEVAREEFGFEPLSTVPGSGVYDGVILAVAHREFVELGADRLRAFGRGGAVFFDVKSAFDKSMSDGRL
jgi:UDP-N-acetyl-D-galactosamine dehydrogenase